MGGGGGGAVGMRLNIMTALYLPILGYAMSTFDLDASALVISSSNLEAYAVPQQRTVALGQEFTASIMYELKPTEAQLEAANAPDPNNPGAPKKEEKKEIFSPKVEIDYSVSPKELYYDSVRKQIVFNTAKVFEGEKDPNVRQKTVTFKARIIGAAASGLAYYREVTESFNVFKPYVDVQSNAAPRLLAGCENSLKFNVPGIEVSELVLRDKSTGKQVSGGTITWTPTGDTTVISVFRQSKSGELGLIDNKGFKVTPPPPPSVFVRLTSDRSKPLLPSDQVDLRDDFELVIKPDPTFLVEFPKDAGYRPGGMRVTIARPGLSPQEGYLDANYMREGRDVKNGKARGEEIYTFSIYDALDGATPKGSGVSFILEKVSRVNYENRSFDLDPTSVNMQFSFRGK
jgi:hypothetical protein